MFRYGVVFFFFFNFKLQKHKKSKDNLEPGRRAAWWLSGLAPPSAQGLILETWDQVPCQAPCMEPASLYAYVSASLSVYLS